MEHNYNKHVTLWIITWSVLIFVLLFGFIKEYLRFSSSTNTQNFLSSTPSSALLEYPQDSGQFLHVSMALKSTSGWGKAKTNKNVNGSFITIAGEEISRGIGTHAESELVFDIPKEYRFFRSVIGIDDKACEKGTVQFKVLLDEIVVYISPIMKHGKFVGIEIPLKNAKRITLLAEKATNGISCDWANWGYARLVI